MTRILITGAGGAVGRALLEELAGSDNSVIATDVLTSMQLPADMTYQQMDVRGSAVAAVVEKYRPEVIIHLASIVTPPKGSSREFAYSVDVTGTQNVLNACTRHGVGRIVITSSGAAYGYHPDNPVPLTEENPLRGNRAFAYAYHKRLVEEMAEQLRQSAPELEQVILRVGTVLGEGLENQITALFHRKHILAIRGSDSPFVFIWTRDLARILARAVTDAPAGIFNVAGDGAVSVMDIAATLNKPVRHIPAWLLKTILSIAHPLRLSRYGPQQVRFLQFRPVLDNTRLKTVFGYHPQKSSTATFDLWRRSVGL